VEFCQCYVLLRMYSSRYGIGCCVQEMEVMCVARLGSDSFVILRRRLLCRAVVLSMFADVSL